MRRDKKMKATIKDIKEADRIVTESIKTKRVRELTLKEWKILCLHTKMLQ